MRDEPRNFFLRLSAPKGAAGIIVRAGGGGVLGVRLERPLKTSESGGGGGGGVVV
jgi:hypothetical protein